MRDLTADELRKILLDVDEEATLELGVPDEPYEIIIAGGCAMLLADLTDRQFTRDIDMVEFDSRLREILGRHPEMNSVAFVYECSLPDGWDERLRVLELPTESVRYLVPSNEDLAVMKLYSARDQDLEDLNSPEFLKRLDWDKLEQYVMDERGADVNLVSPRAYREMVDMYKNYREWNGK